MAAAFSELPSATKSVQPFTLSIPDSSLEELHSLLKLAKIGPTTWESSQDDRRYGITAAWLASAKEHWINRFDWYDSHPSFSPIFKTIPAILGLDLAK